MDEGDGNQGRECRLITHGCISVTGKRRANTGLSRLNDDATAGYGYRDNE